jgi:hypothetical protein
MSSRAHVLPLQAHRPGWWTAWLLAGVAAANSILADFVERGTTEELDTTRCNGAVVVPSFALTP